MAEDNIALYEDFQEFEADLDFDALTLEAFQRCFTDASLDFFAPQWIPKRIWQSKTALVKKAHEVRFRRNSMVLMPRSQGSLVRLPSTIRAGFWNLQDLGGGPSGRRRSSAVLARAGAHIGWVDADIFGVLELKTTYTLRPEPKAPRVLSGFLARLLDLIFAPYCDKDCSRIANPANPRQSLDYWEVAYSDNEVTKNTDACARVVRATVKHEVLLHWREQITRAWESLAGLLIGMNSAVVQSNVADREWTELLTAIDACARELGRHETITEAKNLFYLVLREIIDEVVRVYRDQLIGLNETSGRDSRWMVSSIDYWKNALKFHRHRLKKDAITEIRKIVKLSAWYAFAEREVQDPSVQEGSYNPSGYEEFRKISSAACCMWGAHWEKD